MIEFKKSIKTLISGLFMGIAGLIPGVSSGTVAVIAGVYTELITSFRSIVTPGAPKAKPFFFLLALFSGVVFSTFAFAGLMEILLDLFPIQMNLFFIGLIAGTTPLLYFKAKEPKKDGPFSLIDLIPLLIALGLVLWLGVGTEENTSGWLDPSFESIVLIFLAGFVSSGAGIVPGISGSMVLLSLGLYTALISSINQLNWIFLIALALGALCGFIVFSRVIYFVMNRYARFTYYAIIGFLIGSAINLWPSEVLKQEVLFFVISGLAVVVGFVLAYLVGGEKKHVKTDHI